MPNPNCLWIGAVLPRGSTKKQGMGMRRKLAAGNWKMHGSSASLAQLDELTAAHADAAVDILICPSTPLIWRATQVAQGTSVSIGAQDCHPLDQGAHTGDVSAPMLTDAGATYVILGHSERRADHGEDDATVCAKTNAALAHGLIPIVCIGESLEQREAGTTLSVLTQQLAGSVPEDARADQIVIAYEPIWAIGTGLTPTIDQIAEAHAHMRAELVKRFGPYADKIRLLYGGSVKAANAAAIFAVPDVDGALVGGASLQARDFSPIIRALEAS